MREVEIETEALQARVRSRSERFLRGPIPINDIARASRVPGQALALLLAAHHRAAITGQTLVTIPRSLLSEFGITRNAKARALHALEEAGLVRVERTRGRGARIALCTRNPRENTDQ